MLFIKQRCFSDQLISKRKGQLKAENFLSFFFAKSENKSNFSILLFFEHEGVIKESSKTRRGKFDEKLLEN
jgi:hypothetical protein